MDQWYNCNITEMNILCSIFAIFLSIKYVIYIFLRLRNILRAELIYLLHNMRFRFLRKLATYLILLLLISKSFCPPTFLSYDHKSFSNWIALKWDIAYCGFAHRAISRYYSVIICGTWLCFALWNVRGRVEVLLQLIIWYVQNIYTFYAVEL